MAKHILIGGAGAPNYGDELIVRGWVEFLSDHIKSDDKIVIYENIAKIETNLHGPFARNGNIEFRDSLTWIAKSNIELDFWGQVLRGYEFVENNGFHHHRKREIDILKSAETIHLHGGGYLNKLFPVKGFYLGLCAALNKAFGTRIFATGIGFGPTETIPEESEAVIAKIFSHFELFELRDVDNYRKLAKTFPEANFSYGLDDCFLVGEDKLQAPHDGKKRLFLSHLTYNVQKLVPEYWEKIEALAKDYNKIVFLESCPWADKKVIAFISEKFKDMEVTPVAEVLDKGIPVGPNDFAFVSRFHIHYVLARLGCIGTFAKDNEYYNVKHQSILDRGSQFREYDGKKGYLFNDENQYLFKTSSDFKQMGLDKGYVDRKIALARQLYRV